MSYAELAAKTQILEIRSIRGVDDDDKIVEDPKNWSREELIEAVNMYGIDRRLRYTFLGLLLTSLVAYQTSLTAPRPISCQNSYRMLMTAPMQMVRFLQCVCEP
jgi:hypothetical protein